MRGKTCLIVAAICWLWFAATGGAPAQEPELTIVKYGNVLVKSPVPDAKVFVDDLYKGPADSVIENITVGRHVISCRAGSQSATSTVVIKRDETLKLEARFEEKKLVPVAEHVAEPETPAKAEGEKKSRPEKPKKTVAEAKKEDRKEERKNPEEERRSKYLNVIKLSFEDIDEQEARVNRKINPAVISKDIEKKYHTGAYYRTKKGVLLCDAGPCEQQWSSSFLYTDEAGKTDSFSLTWKQTVFNGITPVGTYKRELLYCVNGVCKSLLQDASSAGGPINADAERFHITWTRSSLVIRRSDIMKNIIDAGGSVEAY